MMRRPPRSPRGLAPAALLLVLFLAAALVVQAQGQPRAGVETGPGGETWSVVNKGVKRRMATMASARDAVQTLAGMMAGRIRFDRVQARAARKRLLDATRDMVPVFRRPHRDPLSRARPEIWDRWNDFSARARAAHRAAQAVNPDRLNALRATLPGAIRTCLDCHRSYRRDP